MDADGKLVLPGAIDAHTHLEMPFGGTISADSYFTGTRAAACGGTTTIFDFVLQDFNEHMVDAIKRRDALCAPQAAVNGPNAAVRWPTSGTGIRCTSTKLWWAM